MTTAWMGDAACRNAEQEGVFFTGPGRRPPDSPADAEAELPGKEVCLSCDVKAECLDYALAENIQFGVWGGMTTRERRRMRDRLAAMPQMSSSSA